MFSGRWLFAWLRWVLLQVLIGREDDLAQAL
jgi:hypothetical protein